MHRGRSLDIVVSADVLRTGWSGIVRPEAFATAQLFAELVDLFSEPDLAQPDVYALFDGAMRAAADDAAPVRLIPRFELRLLIALGVAPRVEACVHCGESLEGRPAWADLDAGGLACERCRPHRADLLGLDIADAANFRAIAASMATRGARLEATAATSRAIDAFVAYHLGRRPRSWRHLDDVRAMARVAAAS